MKSKLKKIFKNFINQTKQFFKSISKKFFNKEVAYLIGIFIISFIIRRIGLKHGFPLLTHPDEPAILNPVFSMTANKTFNPNTFNRPDQILITFNFFYLNFISYLKFGQSLANTFWEHQLTFHYYGRLLICVLGSIIPIVVYFIGKEFKENFSLPASLVFAFYPSYVIHSHYITPDIPITLFTLLVIYFSIRFLKNENIRNIYIATIFASINTAEKYPGLISLLIIATSILIYYGNQHEVNLINKIKGIIKLGIKNLFIYLIAFYIIAPNVIIEFGKVIETIRLEARSTHLGADNLLWSGNLLFYSNTFLEYASLLSIPFIILGITRFLKLKNLHYVILFYGFIYWIILSKLDLHWERWALPMYISPLFLTSIGIKFLIDKTRIKNYIKFLSLLFISIFILSQLIISLSNSIQFTFQDTRYIALEYCIENGITPENTKFEGYTPFNPGAPGNIFNHDFNASNDKFIILSSQMFVRYYNEPSRYSNEIIIYERIKNNYPLIKEFSPTKNDSPKIIESLDNIIYYIKLRLNLTSPTRYSGPIIKIFSIN